MLNIWTISSDLDNFTFVDLIKGFIPLELTQILNLWIPRKQLMLVIIEISQYIYEQTFKEIWIRRCSFIKKFERSLGITKKKKLTLKNFRPFNNILNSDRELEYKFDALDSIRNNIYFDLKNQTPHQFPINLLVSTCYSTHNIDLHDPKTRYSSFILLEKRIWVTNDCSIKYVDFRAVEGLTSKLASHEYMSKLSPYAQEFISRTDIFLKQPLLLEDQIDHVSSKRKIELASSSSSIFYPPTPLTPHHG
ncbi:hypothetical protein GLOIN_2v1777499 [Rhizophagus clarus]|uniref:Uncharacterized protein n=1 Tax=Rhizophagus clarus TaxID=94130 RepID=A0A8H3QTL0_9GLOM|nr:hypothetical protein GLOIN_2v1777499 [Rhizophagus clarus]